MFVSLKNIAFLNKYYCVRLYLLIYRSLMTHNGMTYIRKYCRWINVSENYAVSIFRFDPKEWRCFEKLSTQKTARCYNAEDCNLV